MTADRADDLFRQPTPSCELTETATYFREEFQVAREKANLGSDVHMEEAVDAEFGDILVKDLGADDGYPKYEKHELIGEGGFSKVFTVFNTVSRTHTVLKLSKKKSTEAVDQFRQEAASYKLIQSEHVVPCLDSGLTEKGCPYLEQSLIRGKTLKQRLSRDRRGLAAVQAAEFARDIARGLAAIHRCDLIHRDIKPSNIQIEEDTNQAIILDLGIATSSFDASLGQINSACTKEYASPEQILQQDITPKSDIYQLGLILLEMLTGRQFGQSSNALLESALLTSVTSGPEINQIIKDCLSQAPVNRPSAKDVVERIEKYLKNHAPRLDEHAICFDKSEYLLENCKVHFDKVNQKLSGLVDSSQPRSRLIKVVGDIGDGKSSIVASWVQTRDPNEKLVVWYCDSYNPRTSCPIRFVAHLIVQLRTHIKDFDSPLTISGEKYLYETDPQGSLMQDIILHLQKIDISDRLLLIVIDGLDEIKINPRSPRSLESTLPALIRTLVEHLPGNFRVVVTSQPDSQQLESLSGLNSCCVDLSGDDRSLLRDAAQKLLHDFSEEKAFQSRCQNSDLELKDILKSAEDEIDGKMQLATEYYQAVVDGRLSPDDFAGIGRKARYKERVQNFCKRKYEEDTFIDVRDVFDVLAAVRDYVPHGILAKVVNGWDRLKNSQVAPFVIFTQDGGAMWRHKTYCECFLNLEDKQFRADGKRVENKLIRAAQDVVKGSSGVLEKEFAQRFLGHNLPSVSFLRGDQRRMLWEEPSSTKLGKQNYKRKPKRPPMGPGGPMLSFLVSRPYDYGDSKPRSLREQTREIAQRVKELEPFLWKTFADQLNEKAFCNINLKECLKPAFDNAVKSICQPRGRVDGQLSVEPWRQIEALVELEDVKKMSRENPWQRRRGAERNRIIRQLYRRIYSQNATADFLWEEERVQAARIIVQCIAMFLMSRRLWSDFPCDVLRASHLKKECLSFIHGEFNRAVRVGLNIEWALDPFGPNGQRLWRGFGLVSSELESDDEWRRQSIVRVASESYADEQFKSEEVKNICLASLFAMAHGWYYIPKSGIECIDTTIAGWKIADETTSWRKLGDESSGEFTLLDVLQEIDDDEQLSRFVASH